MDNRVADELKCLGVTGILLSAAQAGIVKKLDCGMPTCHCPDELGGRLFFEPVVSPPRDWMPTHDHFPKLKSAGGHRVLENSRLAHRLCNRVDYSESIGRSTANDMARVDADRKAAVDGTFERRWLREVAAMLCGADLSVIRALVIDVLSWPDVAGEPFNDRGRGLTGIQLKRGKRPFANVFPAKKSLQFAHGGAPLVGLGLKSESTTSRMYQTVMAAEFPECLDEARVLTAYAYWRAGSSKGAK